MNITEKSKRQQDDILIDVEESEIVQAKYPNVLDCYAGFFVKVYGTEDDKLMIMASSNCPIGSRMSLRFGQEPEDVTILSKGRADISKLGFEDAIKVREYQSRGWVIIATPTLITYSQKTGSYNGEFAILCYNPAYENAVDSIKGFQRNLLKRIKSGDHPHVSLSQKQLEQVIDSNGEWCMTREAPLPKKEKGFAIFKRKQTASESLQDFSYDHKTGCSILSCVLMAAVIALVVWLIFF